MLYNHLNQIAQKDFEIYTDQIEHHLQQNVHTVINSIQALSHSITNDVILNKQEFPYAAIDSFEAYASEARTKQSSSSSSSHNNNSNNNNNSLFDVLFYSPIVPIKEIRNWSNFSLQNYRWPIHATEIYNMLEPKNNNKRSIGLLQLSIQQQQSSQRRREQSEVVIYEYNNNQMNSSTNNNQYFHPWKNVQQQQYVTTSDDDNDDEYFVPSLYMSPPPKQETISSKVPYMNINWFTNSKRKDLALSSISLDRQVALSELDLDSKEMIDLFIGNDNGQPPYDNDKTIRTDHTTHYCTLATPVCKTHSCSYTANFHDRSNNNNTLSKHIDGVGGFIYAIMSWSNFLAQLLPEGRNNSIVFVLHNTCGQTVTYEVNGKDAFCVGEDDLHDTAYDAYVRIVTFAGDSTNMQSTILNNTSGHCQYRFALYPTQTFVESYQTSLPLVLSVSITSIFVFLVLILFAYDRIAQNRDDKIVDGVAKSSAIVSSIFPSNVRDRLLNVAEEPKKEHRVSVSGVQIPLQKNLRSFLAGNSQELQLIAKKDNDDQNSSIFDSKPIADLFPETTVFCTDIVGFTAWSSVREPQQIFVLLETLYHAFDIIAKRRRVFKVETVGDCYIAVCGLPEPRKDHAVIMCRFARDCMFRMWDLVKNLEKSLGPDTSDLSMRMGLHSGPCTAGVLRGERARFQLFGETMNTATLMEHLGERSKIHVSEETAKRLVAARKQVWLQEREEKINTEGKGLIQTYWLELGERPADSMDLSRASSDDLNVTSHSVYAGQRKIGKSRQLDQPEPSAFGLSEKSLRLVGWNVEVLLGLLKQIVSRRKAVLEGTSMKKVAPFNENLIERNFPTVHIGMVIDEVKEIIELPIFDAVAEKKQLEYEESLVLGLEVERQLEEYIMTIAAGYRDNPFHNYEHASHVSMSVLKLLSRIVAPTNHFSDWVDASSLHDHTYGITSDPLTQFSCVLSALFHDLDHPGVPNAQLIKEGAPVALKYKNKSIAEQNSVDIAWNLLMQPKFKDLRAAIYSNESEMKRFRQLIVNSVMATDIVDKELKELRNARWDKAFIPKKSTQLENERDQVNRKATIVIEHLIQASDVAHTMQHWHIYRKWNERFFMECYEAYKLGRAESDPSINWYKGEIGFFDFYIIPLAKKLKNCGVFGVSSDEYLNYALKNRVEWENRGQEIVTGMIERAEKHWSEKKNVKKCEAVKVVK